MASSGEPAQEDPSCDVGPNWKNNHGHWIAATLPSDPGAWPLDRSRLECFAGTAGSYAAKKPGEHVHLHNLKSDYLPT